MAIKVDGKTAILSEIVSVEEAQVLHEFLLENKDAEIDLYDARHLHTAVLQVLIAARPKVSRPFADKYMRTLVLSAFCRQMETL